MGGNKGCGGAFHGEKAPICINFNNVQVLKCCIIRLPCKLNKIIQVNK